MRFGAGNSEALTRKRKEDEMEVNWFAAETDYVKRGIILSAHLDFVGQIIKCNSFFSSQ